MDRITKKDLHMMLERVNNKAELSGRRFSLGCAYGGYRLEEECGAGVRDRSFRVTAKEMYFILDAIDNILK